MAEDFQAAICGDNWWSSSRSMFVAVGGLSPCSVGIGDLGWPPVADDFLDIKPKSATESNNNNNSSMLFQDYSTLQMMGFALSSPSDDLLCGGGGGDESNLMNSNNGMVESSYNEEIRKDWRETRARNLSCDSRSNSCIKGLKEGDDDDYNLLEKDGVNNSINCSSTTTPTCEGLFPLDSSTLYGYPSTKLLQSLYDDHPLYNSTPSVNTNSFTFPTNNNPNHLSLASTPNFPSNYLKPPSSLPNPPPQPHSLSPALHFTNNTPFWNASPPPSSTDIIPQGIASLLEHNSSPKSHITTLALKPIHSEDGQEPKKGDKNSATEPPVFKRPRIETPSPLPTFKVRKEKLGDRVTALQQLVSPFGKTDTASVLHEAIEYIKFLHDQVSVLSTPYMKSNNGITPVHHQQVSEKADPDCPKQDLRSRGLCLVPISSTFPVTNATTADFWTPTFGGTFR